MARSIQIGLLTLRALALILPLALATPTPTSILSPEPIQSGSNANFISLGTFEATVFQQIKEKDFTFHQMSLIMQRFIQLGQEALPTCCTSHTQCGEYRTLSSDAVASYCKFDSDCEQAFQQLQGIVTHQCNDPDYNSVQKRDTNEAHAPVAQQPFAGVLLDGVDAQVAHVDFKQSQERGPLDVIYPRDDDVVANPNTRRSAHDMQAESRRALSSDNADLCILFDDCAQVVRQREVTRQAISEADSSTQASITKRERVWLDEFLNLTKMEISSETNGNPILPTDVPEWITFINLLGPGPQFDTFIFAAKSVYEWIRDPTTLIWTMQFKGDSMWTANLSQWQIDYIESPDYRDGGSMRAPVAKRESAEEVATDTLASISHLGKRSPDVPDWQAYNNFVNTLGPGPQLDTDVFSGKNVFSWVRDHTTHEWSLQYKGNPQDTANLLPWQITYINSPDYKDRGSMEAPGYPALYPVSAPTSNSGKFKRSEVEFLNAMFNGAHEKRQAQHAQCRRGTPSERRQCRRQSEAEEVQPEAANPSKNPSDLPIEARSAEPQGGNRPCDLPIHGGGPMNREGCQ